MASASTRLYIRINALRLAYPNLPGNPDSTQPKSALARQIGGMAGCGRQLLQAYVAHKYDENHGARGLAASAPAACRCCATRIGAKRALFGGTRHRFGTRNRCCVLPLVSGKPAVRCANFGNDRQEKPALLHKTPLEEDQRQAEQTYLRGHASCRLDKVPPFGGVEIFPATGLTKEALAVVKLAPATLPRLKQNGRFCFSRGVFAELQRTCTLPCRCHADFSVLHGSFCDSKIKL